MQPIVEVAQRAHATTSERFRRVVEGLPDAALMWQPPAADANSVAQLVRHVAIGQRHIHGMAAGTRAELLDLLARMDADREALLARLDALDLGEAIPAGGRYDALCPWWGLASARRGSTWATPN